MESVQMPPKHPFDEPYGLIKQLQADVEELKANLRAEKEMRAKEVTTLTRENEILNQQLATQRQENKASFDRLSAALTSETALRGKQMAKHEERINGTVAKQEELMIAQENLGKTVLKFTGKVDTEISDRKAACEDLDKKLKKEIKEREAACLGLSNRLDDANDRNRVDFSKRDEVLHGIMTNMQSAGKALGYGSASPPMTARSELSKFGASGASWNSTHVPASPKHGHMSASPAGATPRTLPPITQQN